MVTKVQVETALKECVDPELNIDIVTLGLVYEIKIENSHVGVRMTFTTPMCPYGPALVEEIKGKLIQLPGVKTCDVEIVFDPPWKPSEEVMATLGL